MRPRLPCTVSRCRLWVEGIGDELLVGGADIALHGGRQGIKQLVELLGADRLYDLSQFLYMDPGWEWGSA